MCISNTHKHTHTNNTFSVYLPYTHSSDWKAYLLPTKYNSNSLLANSISLPIATQYWKIPSSFFSLLSLSDHMQMEVVVPVVSGSSTTVLHVALVSILIAYWVWRVLNWVWFRPKKLESFMRKQGLSGNSYRFLFGDAKESSLLLNEAHSKPMNLIHDIYPRVLPFIHRTVQIYGKKYPCDHAFFFFFFSSMSLFSFFTS